MRTSSSPTASTQVRAAYPGEHFEKFVAKLESTDLLSELKPNQFVLFNVPDGIQVSAIISHFKRNSVIIDSVQFKKNFLGSIVGILVQTRSNHSKEQLLAASQSLRSHGKNLRPYFASDAEENPADKRTVVISNIRSTQPMLEVLKKIDQVTPVVTFEFAVKYTNASLTETEELLLQLHSNQQLRKKLAGKAVEIHEVNGDSIGVIKLNPDFTIKNPNKKESSQH